MKKVEDKTHNLSSHELSMYQDHVEHTYYDKENNRFSDTQETPKYHVKDYQFLTRRVIKLSYTCLEKEKACVAYHKEFDLYYREKHFELYDSSSLAWCEWGK